MLHLRSVALKSGLEQDDAYPFSLPLIRGLQPIQFQSEVTFLVGENGCGKSTLMEGMAAAAGTIAAGSHDIQADESLLPARKLGARLRLAWRKRTRRGFFLRAEDFFGFAARLQRTVRELDALAATYDEELTGYGRQSAMGAMLGQKQALLARYQGDLDASSHGEAFTRFFEARFVPGGLYFLDEPEAPLSPLRQLAFLSLLKKMVAQDAQFIIATHSPILMAFPGATLLHLHEGKVQSVQYDEVEHVRLTKSFLNSPQTYLRRL